MRFTSLLAPLPIVIVAACGLESGGLGTTPPADSGLEDRGVGMTDSGGTCLCVPSLGAGWRYIAYARDGSDSCAGDFGQQKFAVEEANTGPAQCTCTCGAPTTNSTCAITGNISFTTYLNNNCGGSADSTVSGPPGCYDPGADYNPSGTVSAKGTATVVGQGGTCAPPATTTTVPSDLHKGQTCALSAALGSGCMNMTDSCVPKVPSGFSLCVAIDQADAMCPAGFDVKHRVGVGKTDSRACAACACNPDPVCAAGAQFNSNNNCGGNQEGNRFALDNACHVVTTSGITGHAIFSNAAVTMQRCTSQGGTAMGTVSLDSEYTICCP